MRRLAALALVLLAGCGGGSEAPAPASRLTVAVRLGDQVHREVVDCPGDARCARLRKADFKPPDGAVACTQIYGGRATAHVTGRIDGRRIDASFDLHDGCAIARWQAFAWLLGQPPRG